jgi:hypothetical protein
MIWDNAALWSDMGRLVEDCLALDLAGLMRLGPIREGMTAHGELAWSQNGEQIQAIRFRLHLRRVDEASLTLQYQLCSANRQPREISQEIQLAHTRPNFGGRRWWLRCPVTGERARTLYLPPAGERFASRKAWGLAYRVETLNRFDRPFEKLFRAQRRLGHPQSLAAGLERPKGMWRRTFARHAKRFAVLDLNCAEKISVMIERA